MAARTRQGDGQDSLDRTVRTEQQEKMIETGELGQERDDRTART